MKETHYQNYELLAHHIIVQAMVDYVELRRLREDSEYRKNKYNWNNRPVTELVLDAEWNKLMKFFGSTWFRDLTDTDPDWLLEKLDKAYIYLRDAGKFEQNSCLKIGSLFDNTILDWCESNKLV